MRIDWQTVSNCISRSLHDLEPERASRLNVLVNIGIDETSYRKGHKYITVIVNHKIKLIIRKVYGFRNIQNMMDMVYLVCSDIRVPLPNRKPMPVKTA